MYFPLKNTLKRLFPFFLLIAASIYGATSESIDISNLDRELSVSSSVLFFEDTSGHLTFEQIRMLPDSCFKKSNLKTPAFGFCESSVWAKVNITNRSEITSAAVLEVAVPSIHQIDFFSSDSSGHYSHQQSGFLLQGTNRALPFLNPAFNLPHNMKNSTIFMRLASSTPLTIPIFIKPLGLMHKSDNLLRTFLGLYFGALLFLALYHLFLFPQLHDKSYLHYVLFVFTFAIGQMAAVYGFLLEDIFPGFSRAGIDYFHIINYTSALFAILFSRSILAVDKYSPRLDKIIIGICIFISFMILISPFLDFRNKEKILVFLNIIPSLALIVAAIAPLKAKYRPAIYFLEAAGVSVAGLLLYNFMYGFNILPFSRFLYFVPNISSLVTVLLFSIAQADRIRLIKLDRERAQLVALKNLKQALQFQEQKNTLEEELFHARKMEALGRLISGISHDLRNMLTPFFGYPQLIKSRFSDNPTLVSYSDRMMDAAQKAKDLTSKLLNFSSKTTQTAIPFDLKTVVAEVADILRHSIDKNIVIENTLKTSMTLIGDNSQVQNAVLNLALNARDAMPQGGKLVFSGGNCTLTGDKPFLRIFEAEPGPYYFISVEDSGIGMDEETMEHLFEPFFTTKEKGKGTGLGLANVYGAVKSHKGCIEVVSEKEKGAIFTLYFPTPTGTIQSQNQTRNQFMSGKGTILLVDDDEDVIAVVEEVLTDMGYTVEAFNKGQEAIDWYRHNPSAIDLAVLDMIMPKKKGHEVFAELRSINPKLPGIIVTGYSDPLDLLEAKKLGISEIIDKPFEIETLSIAISNILKNCPTSPQKESNLHA